MDKLFAAPFGALFKKPLTLQDTVDPGIDIVITPSEGWVQSATYTAFAGSVTHSKGGSITGVEYKVDDGSYAAVDSFVAPNWSQSTMTLSEGANTIYVRATDNNGKTAEMSLAISVDTMDPIINLGADVEYDGLGATFTLDSSMFVEVNPDTVRYKIVGGALPGTWNTWASPYADTDITVPATEDNYTITLEVTDLSGRSVSDDLVYSVLAVPEGVDFDGANDYIVKTTNFTGLTDSKTFTLSAFVYVDEGVIYELIANNISDSFVRFYLRTAANGSFTVFGVSSAPADILNVSAPAGTLPIKTWTHILVSVDLANTSNRSIYISDMAISPTWTTYVDAQIDFTANNGWLIAASIGGTGKTQGRLAHVFLDTTYRDLSVEATRRNFIDSELKPVDASSLSPPVYFKLDSAANALVNSGTGGNADTLNGTVATSGRGPNQDNCVASEFDGSADYLSAGGTSIGVKTVTFSAIINSATAVEAKYPFTIHNGNDRHFQFQLYDHGHVVVRGQQTGGSDLLYATVANGWTPEKQTHIAFSCDMSDTGKRHFYINGVAQSPTYPHYYNANFATDATSTRVGRNQTTSYYEGTVNEIWFDDSYTDLSTNNIFWDSDAGKPKTVAQVISETGTTPIHGLPVQGNDAGNNLGSSGDFTVNSGPYTGARGMSEFWASSVDFDGSTDYYQNSGITGISAGKVITIAFAARPDTIAAGQDTIYSQDDSGSDLVIWVERNAAELRIYANNNSTATILQVSVASFFAADTWVTGLISIDLSDSGKRYIYKDGVVTSPTWTTYTNDSINFDSSGVEEIGRKTDASNLWDGEIGFLWFDTRYIDISNESERLKFFDAFNYPVDLGADGAIDDTQPLVYMRFNDSSDFGANAGSGGNFTENGTITQGADVRG